MKSKKQDNKKDRVAVEKDYYRLNTRAVDDLVDATPENSPKVSEEELRKYRSGLAKYKFSDWAKVLLVKFWFPAAVCYYMLWGLGTYVSSNLDLLFITAIALGVVTDLLTNNLLRYFAKTEGEYDCWMMFPKKRYLSFFFNIIYAMLVLFLVYTFYSGINMLLELLPGNLFLGVGPILFGIFYCAFDLLLIGAKHLLFHIVQDARSENR